MAQQPPVQENHFFRDSVSRVVALLVAWGLVIVVAAGLGAVLGILLWEHVVAWLCLGLMVMIVKRVRFPLPRGDSVDVLGGLRMLGWAALWPRYLRR